MNDITNVVFLPKSGKSEAIGRIAIDASAILFEYTATFRDREITLNPFWKNASTPITTSLPHRLHGVFQDSLPDS